MKKFSILLLTLLLPLLAGAQVKFGYFSYEEAFTSMPEYAIARTNLQDLRNKYDAETKRRGRVQQEIRGIS